MEATGLACNPYMESTNVHGVWIIGSKQVSIPLGGVTSSFYLVMRADFSIRVWVFNSNTLFLSPLPLSHLISLCAFHLQIGREFFERILEPFLRRTISIPAVHINIRGGKIP